jgi:O-antigen/teichoic acid export membrane protein
VPERHFSLLSKLPLAAEERALLSTGLSSMVVRLLGMAASFVMGVLLARWLSPAGFGTYGIIVALALVLSVLAQFGLPTVATRQVSVALAQNRWSALRGYVWAFASIVAASSVALAILWAGITVSLPVLTGSVAANLVGSFLVPLFALTVLVSAELRALDRVVRGQSLEVTLRPALMCALLLFISIIGMQLTAPIAVGLNVIASAVTLAAGLIWLRSSVPYPARHCVAERPREWFRPAAALAAVDVLKQLDVTYGMLLLGALSSETQAGYFRVALSTIIFVSTPLSIFNVVLAPALARLFAQGERDRLQRILTLSALAMFATTIAALMVIFFAGQPLIRMVFGASYEPAWLPLLLLTCAQAINGFFGVGWVLLSMSGGERRLTASFIASVGVSVLAAIPLTAFAGAAGAGAAAIIGALIQNLLAWRGVHRHSSLESSAGGFLWQARAHDMPPD